MVQRKMSSRIIPSNTKCFIWIFMLVVLLSNCCNTQISPGGDSSTTTFSPVLPSSSVPVVDICGTGIDDCTLNFAQCVNDGDSYKCVCNQGLTGNGRGSNGCQDINECNIGTCSTNADCINSVGSYTCTCKAGFTGDGLTCTDIDECLTAGVCDINADCTNTVGSYFCSCKSGYRSDFDRCVDVDECTVPSLNLCVAPATCNNIIGSYECVCPTGYSSSSQFQCDNINECLVPALNNCDANADCSDTEGSFNCVCKDGFEGNGITCTDVNECLTQQCDINALCSNTIGGYFCTCKTGYEGTGITCTDLNECLNNATNKCNSPANCVNTIGSFECQCPNGYTKSGQFGCLDINECSNTPCPAQSICENAVGSYRCVCNSGYQGANCEDINECLIPTLNTCSSNALCTNTVGSFECACNTGFSGNGFNCENINECLQDNNCDTTAACTDTIGSYTCACSDGYSGNGLTCTDINECSTNICDQNCVNLPGSYQCSCNSGYNFLEPHSCSDINECATSSTNNCNVNAACLNTDGSFNCTCNSGFFGDGVDCRIDYYANYKDGSYIQNVDVNQPVIRLQAIDGIPLSGALYHDIYVCVNGFISFGKFQCESGPEGDLGTTINEGIIFAPYFADIDTSIPAGVQSSDRSRVYYSFYQANDNNAAAIDVRNTVRNMIRSKTTQSSFEPSTTIIVTWDQVVPYPAVGGNDYYSSDLTASFQLVLTTNNIYTFVYYIYHDMLWADPTTIFRVLVGYRYNPTLSITPQVPSDFSRLRFDKAPGNKGEDALWLFEVSNSTNNNAATECNAWSTLQPTVIQIAALRISSKKTLRRMSCPCSIQQVVYDKKYKAENSFLHSKVECVYKRNGGSSCGSLENQGAYCIQRKQIWYTDLKNTQGDKYAVVTRCCYDVLQGALLEGGSTVPLTQNHFQSSSQTIKQIRKNREQFRATAIIEDETPFKKCCTESAKCDDYQQRVIVPTCSNYKAPQRSSSYGDPHLVTTDGLSYSFNGLGDFILANSSEGFQIHSRTCNSKSGAVPSKATVFCAFAMTDIDEPLFEFYYDLINNVTVLYVDGTMVSLVDATYNNTDITYDTSGDNPILELSFISGVTVEISIFTSIEEKMLQAIVSTPDELAGTTVGLLGNANGNSTDDLISRSGVLIPSISTEEQIYNQFGITWIVLNSERLFSSTHPGPDPAFVPTFFTTVSGLFNNNQTAVDFAINLCGSTDTNRECFFDLAISNSSTLAANGKKFVTQANDVVSIVNTNPPLILGPTSLNVTLNVAMTFTIQATTNSSSNITYFINTNQTKSFRLLDNKTGVVEFTPTQFYEAIEIGATDGFGLSSVLQLPIIYCYCKNNGTCDYSTAEIEDVQSNVYLKYTQCICPVGNGYEGSHCETEVDVCIAHPCFVDVKCTQTQVGTTKEAVCDPCPTGFIGNGRKCYDLDDCAVTKPCEQVCQNTIGSYSCSCNSGYNLFDNTRCSDVDECTKNPSLCANPIETCVNTIGSYQCQCISGYRENSTGTCLDIDECLERTDSCQQNCYNTPGNYNCSCNSGYTLDANGRTCTDIDECSNNEHNCTANATCSNTIGGFLCSCNTGFSGNGINCQDVNECDPAIRTSLGLTACTQNCVNTPGSYQCQCNAGYTLSADRFTCVENLNPCLTGAAGCHSNATCSYANSQVTCACNDGFQGNGNNCSDINECNGNSGCQLQCDNFPGGFRCICPSGYTLNSDGKSCDDVNECILGLSNCPNNSQCENSVGAFVCNCITGYTKSGNVCIDRNECDLGESGCSQNCTNTEGSFECGCQTGYSLNTDRKTCDNINECLFNTDQCSTNATCNDNIGSYSCACVNGYKGDGRNCADINECITDVHDCSQTCVNTPGSFKCKCIKGFTLQADGKTCADDNECLLGTSNCAQNQTCFNERGSFTCRGLCPGNCEQSCNDTSTGFKCYCSPGYQQILGQSNKCEDVNECTDSNLNTCDATASCINTVGSFNCQCPQGFTGNGKSRCTALPTTSAPYTTTAPNQILVLSGNISVFNSILNSELINLNDATTVNQLRDPTSQLYKDYKKAIQNALKDIYERIEPLTELVEVIKLFVEYDISPNVFVQHRVYLQNTFNTPISAVQNALDTTIRSNNFLLSNTNLTGSIVQSSAVVGDENECFTGLHQCHSNAFCSNTLYSYTCTCNDDYEGDGFTCTVKGGGDTDTLVAILATVIVAFLILIIVIVWFLVVRRRRKREIMAAGDDGSSSFDGSTSWAPFPFGQMRARSMYVPSGVVPTQYRDISPEEQ